MSHAAADPSPQRFVSAAFDAIAANVAILDAQGRIVAENRAWLDFALRNGGCSTLGTNYLGVCQGTQGDERDSALSVADGIRAVLSGERPTFELEYPCEVAGELLHFLLRVTRFEQDGQPFGVVTHQDITRLKVAELEVQAINEALRRDVGERTRELESRGEALARRERDLRQFRFAGSHDLQEPLRMISMYAGMLRLRHGARLDEQAQVYLRGIDTQVVQAREVVSGVVTLATLGDTGPTARVALAPLVREVWAARPVPEGAELGVEGQAAVQANPGQLRALLEAVLDNAVKFRRADRPLRVAVTLELQGAEVVCRVRDNGIGIAPEYHDLVFGVFKRLHTRDAIPGHGIGLAVAQRVVEGHGGRVSLTSNPDCGITLTFTLPGPA